MKHMFQLALAGIMSAGLIACGAGTAEVTGTEATAETGSGQSAVQDDESAKDVVKVAAASPDHSTLVAAVKQAELVDALSNAGPFTVFAPTNAAFAQLPPETLKALMKEDKKADLQNILQYHVYVGIIKPEMLQDGQTLNQVNGGNIRITVKEGKIRINDKANILASVPASNGIIHVIDAVLLPE